MRYLIRALGSIWQLIFTYKRYIPTGMIGLFVIGTFFSDIFKVGLYEAFLNLSVTIAGAEYIINRAVHLAIANDPGYNLNQFFGIIVSVMILWRLIKFLSESVLISFTGSQAKGMAYVVAILMVFLIEWGVISAIHGFGFIPIKDGIYFLFNNLDAVLGNIHVFGIDLIK